MNKPILFLFLALLGWTAPQPLSAHDAAEAMADAAKAFLAALTEEQKAVAVHGMAGDERTGWHFVPKPFEGEGVRGGLPLADMRPDQKQLAYGLLSSGLSHGGFTKAVQIMSLEQVLWELENESPRRNPEMYYLTVFGKPGSDGWGWRVEGHHLSLNFTIADGKVVSGTPSFYATNPAEVLEGPRKGLRVLAEEEDLARALVQSLDEGQRADAVIEDKAPRDILTAAEPEVEPIGNAGIAFGDLDGDQQSALRELIGVYVHRLRPDVAKAELGEIEKAGHDKIVFAWAGGIEKRQPHYYRVQGPTFLLEYANTQNDANHVHAVWREFEGDFGRDILKEHYLAHHEEE